MCVFHARKAKLDRSGLIAQLDINTLFLKLNAFWPQNESAVRAQSHVMPAIRGVCCGWSTVGKSFTVMPHIGTIQQLHQQACVNLDVILFPFPKFCSGSSVSWLCSPTGWKLIMIIMLLITANIYYAPVMGQRPGWRPHILTLGVLPTPLRSLFYHLVIFLML